MKTIHFIALTLFLVLSTFCYGQNLMKPNPNMPKQTPIKDSSDALNRCIGVTQLNLISKKSSAKKITLREDHTPFLASQFKGRTVWQIKFTECTLKLKSALPGFPDNYPLRRIFVANMDAKTGTFLNVTCQFEGVHGEMRPEPSAESAERQIRGINEVFVGLPDTEPKLSFLEAVDAVQSGGVGCPNLAKEIDGIYVMFSARGSAPRPAWIITLRGIPPLPSSAAPGVTDAQRKSTEAPEWMVNHIRNVIDATTGKCIYATNIPNPE